MPMDTEVAIIEMGANHQREIAALCEIALPTHGLITNIGKAHLEGFGGIEGVKKGKGELYDFLAKHRGLAFVNLDEQFLLDLSSEVPFRVKYLKSEKLNPDIEDLETELLQSKPFVKAAFLSEFEERVIVDSHLIGEYNFQNMMSAIIIGRYFKVPAEKVKKAIESYVPKDNRSQFVKQGEHTYLLDAYNANPSSMSNAVAYFGQMEADAKIAILGDMLELGEYSKSEHEQILKQALSYSFDAILLVGQVFSELDSQNHSHVHQFVDAEAVKKWLSMQNLGPTSFLVKGSRGIRLESILEEAV